MGTTDSKLARISNCWCTHLLGCKISNSIIYSISQYYRYNAILGYSKPIAVRHKSDTNI